MKIIGKLESLLMRLFLMHILIFIIPSHGYSSDLQYDDAYVDRIATTCKIWGLVKYFDLSVVSGKTDWDREFIDSWNRLSTVKSDAEFNEYLLSLLSSVETNVFDLTESDKDIIRLNRLEEIEHFDFLRDTIQYDNRLDFRWIFQNELIRSEVENKLLSLIFSYKPRKHVRIKFKKGKIPIHKSPKAEFPMEDSQANYIHGLFKYWNTINYYFAYRELMDQDWDLTLTLAIPSFLEVQSMEDYIRALTHLSSNIDDSHGSIHLRDDASSMESRVLPFLIDYIGNEVIVSSVLHDSIATEYGLSIGSKIIGIGEKAINALKDEFTMEYSFSTSQSFRFLFKWYLWNSPTEEDSILVVFSYGDSVKNTYVPIVDFRDYSQKWSENEDSEYKIFNDSIAYLNLPKINFFEFGKAYRKSKNMPYLILDCRGYGSGALFRLAKRLGSKPTPVARYYHPMQKYPGIFQRGQLENYYFSNYVDIILRASGIIPSHWGKSFPTFNKTYSGQVVVLVDAQAVSFGETVCMVIKAYRPDAIFIGRRTQAANGNIASADLTGGIQAEYSGLDWRYPDGGQFQRIGISPDIIVPTRIESLGQDAILERAIEYISGQ